MSNILKCPYCGSTDCSKTAKGHVERLGGMTASVAAKLAVSFFTPNAPRQAGWAASKVGEVIKVDRICNKCGHTFYTRMSLQGDIKEIGKY